MFCLQANYIFWNAIVYSNNSLNSCVIVKVKHSLLTFLDNTIYLHTPIIMIFWTIKYGYNGYYKLILIVLFLIFWFAFICYIIGTYYLQRFQIHILF